MQPGRMWAKQSRIWVVVIAAMACLIEGTATVPGKVVSHLLAATGCCILRIAVIDWDMVEVHLACGLLFVGSRLFRLCLLCLWARILLCYYFGYCYCCTAWGIQFVAVQTGSTGALDWFIQCLLIMRS